MARPWSTSIKNDSPPEGRYVQPHRFKLLQYLIDHRNYTVSKQELIDNVWKAVVGVTAVDSCIWHVRKAVGDSGKTQRIIKTVYRYGYRFVADVEVRGVPPPPDAIGCLDPFISHIEKETKLPSVDICPAPAEVFEGDGKPIRIRSAKVGRVSQLPGTVISGDKRVPYPWTSAEDIIHELAADADLQSAYHDLKTSLGVPDMRDTVLMTLRAFAQMARSSS